MQRESIIEFERYRHLRLTGGAMSLAVLAYMFDKPVTEPYGGTVLGYILGILAALIVLFLASYGMRKRLTPRLPKPEDASKKVARRFGRLTLRRNTRRNAAFTLQGWLSAHVYWGVALVLFATLHTGFHFGWNLHSLSYVLMLLVVLSGLYGTYAYVHLPRVMTENMGEDTLPGLLAKIDNYDKLAASSSLQFPDEICRLIDRSRSATRIGGSVFEQLSGRQTNCPTSLAVRKLHEMGKEFHGARLQSFHDLYALMNHKEAAVIRARRHIKYKARLALWLYVHAPLSIAFLLALLTHVLAIFFYW